jgi:two-component system chemotaxis sensor kinase CheA
MYASTSKKPVSSDKEPPATTKGETSAVQQTVKIKTAVLDRLLTTTGELVTVKHRLFMTSKSFRSRVFSEAMESLGKSIRELHDQVMAVRLIPLSMITERFPRMVRDLARESGKEVTFSMSGVEIELDRETGRVDIVDYLDMIRIYMLCILDICEIA